jgi:hypothetical protein
MTEWMATMGHGATSLQLPELIVVRFLISSHKNLGAHFFAAGNDFWPHMIFVSFRNIGKVFGRTTSNSNSKPLEGGRAKIIAF